MIDVRAATLETLNLILEAAEKHRAGEVFNTGFRNDSGICDNISSLAVRRSLRDQMLHVKDNLIRQTPSYSGDYHYPVRGADDEHPERAFGRANDMWLGEYGANRVQQLRELIHLVDTAWEEGIDQQRTPAQRHGLKLGDYVRNTINNRLMVFTRDDESTNPGFSYPDNLQHSEWVHLRDVAKVNMLEGEPIPVADLLAESEKLAEQKAALQTQLAEIQQAISAIEGDVSLVDYKLAKWHKVRRLAA